MVRKEPETALEVVDEQEELIEQIAGDLVFYITGATGREYTVKKPAGRAAPKHFTLMQKAMPTSVNRDDNGNIIMSPADLINLGEAFSQWAVEVLPSLLEPGVYDEMPGEDQYGIFMSMFRVMNLNKQLFRFNKH